MHLSLSDWGPEGGGLISQFSSPSYTPFSLPGPPWRNCRDSMMGQRLALGFLEDPKRHISDREIMLRNLFNVWRFCEPGESFPTREITSVLLKGWSSSL